MSIDDQVDLGANDYSPEGKGSGFEQFLSKPVQRQYQPFGGQIQRKQSSVVQPQYVQPEIEEAPQSNYQDPFDEGLDVYDQTKKYHGQISQFARENERSAKHYEKLYDEFKENKFLPFYKQFDEFGDFESDDEYAASLDALYQNDLKSSQEEDSFFGGESESKKLAKARLGKYVGWNQPNGIRDQFLRLKSEKERRRVVADQAKQEEYKLFESLTSIPIPMREQMDQRLKTRSAKPRSKKATDQLLNGFQFEAPIADMNTGEIINLEKTDPRAKTPGFIESNTQRQQKRLEAAMRGDIDGFMSRRETVARDRQLRDRGILFSQSGLLDGRPVGLSRKDVDLLDIDEMKKLGIKEYKGVPIEQAFNDLGGEESLNMAKVMQAVRGSYSNYEDAQINWLTNGRKASDKAAMESSKAAFDKSIQLAAEFGLTDEVVEQTEKKGFFSRMSESIANAFRRGLKMNEMSEYSYDFFTNAADQSDFEKFIEISEELGEIPTSSAAKKFQQYKSKGFWDSVSNLLFDNAEAIPELFVESLSSFLPAYVRTGFKTIPGAAAVGGAAGLAGGPLAPVTVTGGAVSGATLAARANWGVASFVLEYSGMILEGMQELNIDYKNPKVFAAAWNNEITRDAIKEKALKKGLPIALLDSISGLMGSRVAAALHHGGNAIKGGKLIDGAAWKRSKQTYPKFTAFQRAGNAGLEVGTDAALGMGGEFLGQAWSKEPGEGWDHNAIVAEGIIGLGPGLLGGGYQVASTRNLDLTSTPFDYENVENTETGKTGIVNLAGFRNKFNSFNNAQAAASHVVNEGNFETAEEQENANSVLTDLMARLYELNPKAMTDLKIVVADRTPFSDKEMEGSFHEDGERTGTYAIYLNRNKIGKDPLGVFLHESGHLARKLMLSSEELMGLYESLGIDAQKDAFTQYTLKIPDQKYSQLNEAQKAQVDRAWNDKRMTPAIRAEEWFSYQWASLLAGRNIDSSVKTEYQNFLTKVLHPSMEKFMGGKTTGGTKEQQFRLNQKILQSMGYSTNGYSKQSTPRFGEYYNERPGMAKKFLNKEIALQQMGDDEALNFLMRKVMIIAQTEGKARAKQVAEAVNKMLDKKILPTDMSAYTKLELEEMATPIAEGRVAAEDAVKTAEVYEKLEGADAQEGVKQLLEIEETKPREGSKEKPKPILDEKGRVKPVKKAVESEVTPKVDLSEKEKLTNQVKATKTRKVAKIEKDVDRAQEQLEARVIPVQYLMPGAEIIEKGDKFELKIRQPGTRKPRAPRLFDTKAEAEKAQKEFFTQELKNLKDISKKVSDIQKLAMDETAFNKKSTEVKKKLLEELESEGSAVSERDISHSQIIAEMMGLNSLMDGAIFSSALAAFDLADVSSGKAPDGQRVVEAFAKYEQQVAFAVGSIDTRIAELETRKEFLNLEKQRLNGGITQKAFDQKVKALGSAQDKKGSLPPGKWVVVFRGPQGNWKKWKDGKWVNAPKLDDNKFVRKRLDPKVYGYVKADKEAASKALNEKQRNFISFWREPDNQSKTPAKKTAPKPKPKAEAPKAKADTKAIDAEISEIDKKLTMLREYRDAIEPEKATIDWMDVPHLNYHKFIDPDGDTNAFPTKKNGKRVKKNFERYTLGQLASLDRKSDIWMVYGRPGRETIEKLDGLSDSQAYLFKYTNWRLNSPEPEAKAEGQKPNVEVDPGPMIDPTSSSEKTFERNGEQVRLEIDVNGRAVLYGADNRALNIIKNDLDALVLEKFGKTAKDIAKDLKGVPTKPKFMDPISEKEWSSFTKTGKVSNERLKDIVKKYTQGVKTTPEEVQIFTDMHEDRDKLLAQLQKDPTSLGSGIDQSFNPFAYGRKMTDKLDWFGNKTVKEYTEMLDAVRASAALPETIGGRRYKEGDRIFMQSENGTSVAAMMLFRLKEQDKADGINNRNITSGELSRLTLSEMSVYELATGRSLEILDDRDIRGSKQQRYHQLIERRAHEMTKDIAEYEKLIKDMEEGSEQRAGAERSVTRLRQQLKALFFDYDEPGSFQGEETGGFFPQLHGGKQWSQSLTEYFFYQEKAEAVKKIIGIWAEDIASEQGPGVGRTKKETLSKDPAWSSSVEAWNKLEPAKKAALRNNLYSVVRELKKDESITEEDILKAKEEFEKLQKEAQKSYEEQYEAKTAEETAQAAKEWGTSVTSPDDYEFFAQGEKATSTVKAGNGHGAFARGSADEGVDVLSLFAKGRADKFDPERVTFGTGSGSEQANPDLARDLERRLDEAIVKKSFEVMQDEKYQDIPLFEITRADGQKLKVKRVKGLWKKANGHVIDQETEKIAREDFIKNKPELINEIRNVMVAQDSMGTVGVSSGNSVSPAQFVRYLLDNIGKKKGKAGLKQALLALQYTPSSEVDNGMLKQLPGGPAGGILPYVWNDFMLEVYKLLKIEKDFEFVPAPDPKKSGWKNQSEEIERTITENGKTRRISEPNTLWKNGYPDVDAMVKQVQPVIQAVYDAGRVMLAVGRGFDEEESSKNSLNASNVLQQDPTIHTSSFESFIKSDAPEGSMDNQETDSVVNKDQAKTVQVEEEETASDEDLKKLGDDDLIPQSFSTQNDPISQKLEGTETMRKLFELKKGGKELTLNKVLKEFRTDERLWNAFGMPMPPQKDYLVYKWAKGIKEHPKYPKFKARVLGSDTQALGSSYALSSGIPTDYMQSSVLLTKMANKVGFDDDGRDQLKEFWEKKKAMFKSGDLVSSFIDQSRAGTKFISDALKDMGVTDQKLLDSLDVRGLWHLYYGKTDEQIKTANLRYFEPIRDALNDHGITLEQFGEYLIARVAPSRNKHLKSLYVELMNDAKDEDTKNEIKEMLERRGESLSGVSTEVAIQVVQKMEADEAFMNFLKDEREPLQKFYDMNRESIDIRATSQLIQKTEALDEVTAMVQASSSFNWKKDGGSKIMYMRNGKEDNYSYAPMQGFEGAQETQKLYDNEEAYEVLGKSSSASGRAWDQPKNKFLFKGAFGRREDTLGPNPEMVFAVSQDQYFQSGIRGAKNEVSNSFGAAFELFRAVAYHNSKEVSGLPLVELPDQIKDIIEKDPSVIESTREMFEGKDAIFEKDFNPIQTKKDYKISTKAITVDGEEVEGFKMVTREINTEFQNDTHVFVYRKNGVPQYIKFRKNLAGSRVARSVKNLRYEALPTFLKGVNSVTRFMASMFTSKNPAFMIPNFIRDLGTMFIHLTEDDKKQFVKAAFNPKRLGGFIKHITLAERKNFKGDIIELDPGELTSEEYAKKLIKDGDYAKVYQLAKASGAKVGYFRHKSIPELIDEMKADTGKSRKGARKKWNSFVNYLDTVNTALENSIRMSAFASAIEAGFTTHQAAVISRNVTVDFNQKGELTQTMGALFVFFGASMNSMHRMMSTFKKRTPQERKKLIIGIAGASFALNIFNRLMDDDDEEPLPDYDTISEFRRDTMAIVGDPRDKNTGYFGVPLPLGYNMFWTLGQTAGDVFAKYVMGRGGAGAVDFLTRNLNATLNGFNPIGGSTLATAMIPTVGKPMAELWANQNFMGMPIRNEDRPYEAVKPAHMMDPKRTQEHWTALSEGLNSLLGGSDQVKGSVGGMLGSQPLKGLEGTDLKFDISGSQMEHLLLGYAGGPGQIINMMFGSLVFPAFSEEKDYGTYDPNKMPIANRFYRSSTHGSRVKNLYYQVREANKIAERATKAAKIAGPKQFAEANRNMRDLLALSGNIKYTDAFKKKIATHKAKVESSKSLTQDQKLQRIAQLEQKEHAAFVKVIKKAQSLGIS